MWALTVALTITIRDIITMMGIIIILGMALDGITAIIMAIIRPIMGGALVFGVVGIIGVDAATADIAIKGR